MNCIRDFEELEMVFDILMTDDNDFALVFVKLK